MTELNRRKTLALAAVFQAAAVVDSLAWRGQADRDAQKTLLDSVLVFDTDDLQAIYGPPAALKLGLRTLEACLSDTGPDSRAGEHLRYGLGLIHIETRLGRQARLLDLLRQRLEQARARLPHADNDILSTSMVDTLASAYVDTLGTLRFRLQIKGNEQRLHSPGIPEQIRATLLAGVRAAWLWQRLGGRRWHLLFTRGQVLAELRLLIKEAQGR